MQIENFENIAGPNAEGSIVSSNNMELVSFIASLYIESNKKDLSLEKVC